jgi:hypothetical protein
MFKWLPKSKKNQFHVTTREYRVVLVAVVGLMIVAMVFVWSNVRLVGLAYEYQALRKNPTKLNSTKIISFMWSGEACVR